MSQTQYAVCHLQRGSGNDAGMSCHIERKDAQGKVYVPVNADPSRTRFNHELIKFPDGVKNRTEAIQFRIEHAGIHRKVGKNQTKAIRIILTGTHEQMMKLKAEGRLEEWKAANLKWLKDTFGKDNVVSVVYHDDEKTPHLHATIVPIVEDERVRRKREGKESRNKTQKGPRLCCDDVMARSKLYEYQNTYSAAMKPFGLERGIIGSTAKHENNSHFYREEMLRIEENIEKLNVELEKKEEGKSRLLSWIGKGDLAKAKNQIKSKDDEISQLKKQIESLKVEKEKLVREHNNQIVKLQDGYKSEITKAVREAEALKQSIAAKDREIAKKDATIREQAGRIEKLDREAHPDRYRLSSGAELIHFHIPNRMYPNLYIQTKVGDKVYQAIPVDVPSGLLDKFDNGKLTQWELVNELFEPQEQVNEEQAKLLGDVLIAAMGGPGQAHVGTGGGGSYDHSPWGEKKKGLSK